MYNLATKTLDLINHTLEVDQGAKFRQTLGLVIPHIGDAYRGEDEGFRSHLGASLIGRKCAREIWYGFYWAKRPRFDGRMLRLFNRGHLEEARFIALLVSSGIQVWQQDANGKQFRVSYHGGHMGGSGDGVQIGAPDFAINQPSLLEFKTHGDASFKKLQKAGVQEAKPEHYTQQQIYMEDMKLGYSLYGAVNKNDDHLHLEVVVSDRLHAGEFIDRGKNIIFMKQPPKGVSTSPGWYECKFCEMKDICHGGSAMAINCRTCQYSEPLEDGSWVCNKYGVQLTKETQLQGCQSHVERSQ